MMKPFTLNSALLANLASGNAEKENMTSRVLLSLTVSFLLLGTSPF